MGLPDGCSKGGERDGVVCRSAIGKHRETFVNGWTAMKAVGTECRGRFLLR